MLKNYSTRSRYNQKDLTKKNGKDRSVMVIRYWGTSPKLGSCQGECPYTCIYVSFFRGGDEGVVDEVVSHIERRRFSNLWIMPLSAVICSFNKIFSRVRYLFCMRANSIILKASISVVVDGYIKVEGHLLILLSEIDPPWPSWSYHPCLSPQVLLSSSLSSLAKHRLPRCWRRGTT